MVGSKVEMGIGGPEQAVLTEEAPRHQYFPYCAINNFITGIGLVCQVGVDRIDRSTMFDNGILTVDERIRVGGALQFLGLTDQDGNLTNKGIGLRMSTKKRLPSTFLRIAREAYGQEPIQIAKESLHAPSDLKSYFMDKNGINPEMATKQYRVFLELLRMGDVELLGMPRRRQRRPKAKSYTKIASLDIPGVPSSQIITLEMVKALTGKELEEWFRKRLPPLQNDQI